MKTHRFPESVKKKFAWVTLGLTIAATFYLASTSSNVKKKKQRNEEKIVTSITKKDKKEEEKIKVLTEELAFRSSPEVSYGNQIGTVRKGAVLILLDKQGLWYKVKTPGKRVGYISAKPIYTKKIN